MEQKMAGLFQVMYGNGDGTFRKAEVLKGTDGQPLIIPTKGENEITETICTFILNLPRSLASMVNPSEAAMERRPLTKNSRPMMTTATQAGTMRGLNWTRVT